MRTCERCQEDLPESRFYSTRKVCKDCLVIVQREQRHQNKLPGGEVARLLQQWKTVAHE